MNKKRVLTLALLSLVFFSAITFVAADPSTTKLVEDVQKFFEPILKAIFGAGSQGYVFEELLFALLIIAAVYMALSRVPIIENNNFALWTLTIASAILSVRYIATEGFIKALLLPQGVFGVALLTIIPFVIFALFLEFGLTGTSQRVLRKIGWVVYGVTFVVLWYKQTNVIGAKVGIITIGNIYLFSVIAAVAMFLFDGTIQNAFKKSKARTQREAHAEMHLGDLIKRQKEAYSKSIDPDLTEEARSAHEGEYEKLVKLVKKARKNL